MKGKYKRKRERRLLREKMAIPIENLGLTPRICNLLLKMGLTEAGKVAALSENEVRKLPGIGEVSMQQIRKALNDLGLDFATQTDPQREAEHDR